jgi:hypothetical protein
VHEIKADFQIGPKAFEFEKNVLEPKLKSLKIEQIEFKLTPREPPN